jgi:hypothetical protein
LPSCRCSQKFTRGFRQLVVDLPQAMPQFGWNGWRGPVERQSEQTEINPVCRKVPLILKVLTSRTNLQMVSGGGMGEAFSATDISRPRLRLDVAQAQVHMANGTPNDDPAWIHQCLRNQDRVPPAPAGVLPPPNITARYAIFSAYAQF